MTNFFIQALTLLFTNTSFAQKGDSVGSVGGVSSIHQSNYDCKSLAAKLRDLKRMLAKLNAIIKDPQTPEDLVPKVEAVRDEADAQFWSLQADYEKFCK